MLGKNKKNLLFVFFFLAVFLFIMSLFLPFCSLDYSDVLVNNGYEKPDVYWKDSGSLLIYHFGVYDVSDADNPLEYHMYKFRHISFYFYETGDMSLKDTFSGINYYEKATTKENNIISTGVMPMADYVSTSLLIAFFIYFCYKGYKSFDVRESKYFLYLGLLILVTHISWIIFTFMGYDFSDIYNQGFQNAFSYGIGFFTLLFSSILFFVLYFLKNYFLKTTDSNENSQVLEQ